MGSICIGYAYFPFHDFQRVAIFISLGRVSFSGKRMVTKRLVYLSLELNGMSADSWCWVSCPLVLVSLSPWGAVALTSVYVRARTLVLSGSLFVSLLVIAEVFLFQPGRFAAVTVSSLRSFWGRYFHRGIRTSWFDPSFWSLLLTPELNRNFVTRAISFLAYFSFLFHGSEVCKRSALIVRRFLAIKIKNRLNIG
jgi:hypothetical protein